MKKFYFVICSALSFLVAACAPALTEEQTEKGNVKLEISLPGMTRTDAEMLYPINVFYTAKGGEEILGQQTITSGTTVGFNLYKGEYEFYAVCGMPTDMIPENISTDIITPATISNWHDDFALGVASLTISPDVSETQTLQIVANHQMSWLDLTITNVPSSITDLTLFVSGIADKYSISMLWGFTSNSFDQYAVVPLRSSSTETFTGSAYVPPTASDEEVTFIVAAKYSSGKTSFLTYTSDASLGLGAHLEQNLSFNQLLPMNSNISLTDWDVKTPENKELSDSYEFSIGGKYFFYPATTIYVGDGEFGNTLNIFPHKPLEMTIKQITDIEDLLNLSVSGLPDISVNRWYIAQNDFLPNKLLNVIRNIGLDSLNEQIVSSGNTSIDENATNVLAYVESSSIPEEIKFYRYDFKTMTCVPIPYDTKTTYLIYPFGSVELNYLCTRF